VEALLKGQVQAVGVASAEAVQLRAHHDALRQALKDPTLDLRTVGELRAWLLDLKQAHAAVQGLEALIDQVSAAHAGDEGDAILEKVEQRLSKADTDHLAGSGAKFVAAQSTRHGIGLPHQVETQKHPEWQPGRYIAAGLSPAAADQIKAFDQALLQREQNAVVGPSGNTNIMTFLYQQIAREDPDFSVSDGLIGTLAYLTFDGGHSLADTLSTYRAIRSDPRDTRNPDTNGNMPDRDAILATRAQALKDQILDYTEFATIFENPDARQAVESAVQTAFSQTRDSFNQVHAQRLA
jgi:hypothetical protein